MIVAMATEFKSFQYFLLNLEKLQKQHNSPLLFIKALINQNCLSLYMLYWLRKKGLICKKMVSMETRIYFALFMQIRESPRPHN